MPSGLAGRSRRGAGLGRRAPGGRSVGAEAGDRHHQSEQAEGERPDDQDEVDEAGVRVRAGASRCETRTAARKMTAARTNREPEMHDDPEAGFSQSPKLSPDRVCLAAESVESK